MDEPRRFVVVGLGNPGPRYQGTRHNAGFLLVDRLAAAWKAETLDDDPTYIAARARVDGATVHLLKPMTYMNRSGIALSRFAASREAAPEEHLVVLDDVSLPFGSIRFRKRGSDGGQKGLRSVLDTLGSSEVPRLRLGVGDGEPGRDLAEYVLEPFSSEEEKELDTWLGRAVDGVEVFLREGADAAMNRFNR